MKWEGFFEDVLQSQYLSEAELQDKYPALKLAYVHYMTLLKLCQEKRLDE